MVAENGFRDIYGGCFSLLVNFGKIIKNCNNQPTKNIFRQKYIF
jgi:hypothetical protein